MKYIYIDFYLNQKQINRNLVESLVKSLLKQGSKLSDNSCYLQEKKTKFVYTSDLEKIIKAISESGGAIYEFVYRNFLWYSLRIWQSRERLVKIRISAETTQIVPSYDERDKNKEIFKDRVKRGLALAEVAKVAWNSLPVTPICGIGDDEVYWTENEKPGKALPTDDDIINLNIEKPFGLSYWLNFYGKELIGKIGKEKILQVEKWKLEEFKNGVLIMMYPLPCTFYSWPKDYKFLSKKEMKELGLI